MQTIYLDHIDAASNYVKDPYLLTGLVRNIQDVCAEALQLLCAANLVNHDVSHIRDRIISTGEVLACHFLCAVLEDRGIPAEVVNLSEIISPEATTRSTQSFYSDISVMMADRICSSQDKIPVVTGFFGPIDGGLLNLIGRGYTDLCASLISIGLQASELQVWKEVEGIFTADPCKVPSARMIPLISSEEASELTFHGSEVIHYTAMRLAMRARIQIRIKNVMSPEAEGTLVRDDEHTDTTLQLSPSLDLLPQVTNYSTPIRILGGPIAITSKDNILLINLRSAERLKPHRFFASIFSILDRWNLSIDLLCTSEVQISLALHSEVSTITGDDTTDPKNLQANLRSCIAQLQEYGSVDILPHRTIVSIVGKQMKQELGTAGMMFSTLGENGICVEMIAQGDYH
jgi:aspartate kinase